jgi:hypothetical protein
MPRSVTGHGSPKCSTRLRKPSMKQRSTLRTRPVWLPNIWHVSYSAIWLLGSTMSNAGSHKGTPKSSALFLSACVMSAPCTPHTSRTFTRYSSGVTASAFA